MVCIWYGMVWYPIQFVWGEIIFEIEIIRKKYVSPIQNELYGGSNLK